MSEHWVINDNGLLVLLTDGKTDCVVESPSPGTFIATKGERRVFHHADVPPPVATFYADGKSSLGVQVVRT
jgi:hypothetical protein